MRVGSGNKMANNYTSMDDIMWDIDCMEGHDFEYYCAALLQKVGFSNVRVTPGSGDQGVDVLAMKDGIKYAVQCKNYSTPLGNTPVQEVTAGRNFYGCHVGVVMTNSTFTISAVELAEVNNILLWDRKYLMHLISATKQLPVRNDSYFDTSNREVSGKANRKQVFDFNDNFEEEKVERKGMRIAFKGCLIWSGLCAVMALVAFIVKESIMIGMGLAEGGFFLILSLMFNVLSKTSKENEFVFESDAGKITKTTFVWGCIVIAFVVFVVIGSRFGLV